ncbi:F-box incomplete domain containing protein [Pandoravirus neocaledonia]|uniref:F-box incomplete domain containing protein n=1 Tax=Pandoravirus neocaledonia TaxID=2107708 RepID=A0A2U7UDB7_9VIRU|nr:F-box incomplete domain containing protein [Pandoravirus neocaledonia]AVK76320.1 F-box incomplete domain containing protein [Pandoravirus neocaledonia]
MDVQHGETDGRQDFCGGECSDLPVPDEILSMILGMVASVDLVAARWVCKRWRFYAPASSPLGRPYMEALAFCGHLEVAQWARANGCPWSDRVCVGFARCGRVDALEWARTNGCPWDTRTYGEACAAASGGHLDALKWLWLRGRPFQPHVCASAARGDIWPHCNGCANNVATGTSGPAPTRPLAVICTSSSGRAPTDARGMHELAPTWRLRAHSTGSGGRWPRAARGTAGSMLLPPKTDIGMWCAPCAMDCYWRAIALLA